MGRGRLRGVGGHGSIAPGEARLGLAGYAGWSRGTSSESVLATSMFARRTTGGRASRGHPGTVGDMGAGCGERTGGERGAWRCGRGRPRSRRWASGVASGWPRAAPLGRRATHLHGFLASWRLGVTSTGQGLGAGSLEQRRDGAATFVGRAHAEARRRCRSRFLCVLASWRDVNRSGAWGGVLGTAPGRRCHIRWDAREDGRVAGKEDFKKGERVWAWARVIVGLPQRLRGMGGGGIVTGLSWVLGRAHASGVGTASCVGEPRPG